VPAAASPRCCGPTTSPTSAATNGLRPAPPTPARDSSAPIPADKAPTADLPEATADKTTGPTAAKDRLHALPSQAARSPDPPQAAPAPTSVAPPPAGEPQDYHAAGKAGLAAAPCQHVVPDLRPEGPPDHPQMKRTLRKNAGALPTRHTHRTPEPWDVYGRIVQHLVETSSIMRAGATVLTTETGEDLVVPRSTGFVTSAITAEGAQITESDPALLTVTLKVFKYANYFEISQELANDSPTNLLDFLARQAALPLGLGANGYGDDLINGAGTTEPRGLLLDAGTGVTGPAGTGTTLGTQGTLNQGTDALWNVTIQVPVA
jgi:hypothetical protein